MSKADEITTCAYCGKKMLKYRGYKEMKYCSRSCNGKANSKNLIPARLQKAPSVPSKLYGVELEDLKKTCPVCGKVFLSTDSRRKYCSKACGCKNWQKKHGGDDMKGRVKAKEIAPLLLEMKDTLEKIAAALHL